MYRCPECNYNGPYFECIVKENDEVSCPKCDTKMEKMVVKIKRFPITPLQPLEASK